MEIILGIGDYAVTNQLDDRIKTFALGSCVALTLYSPVRKVLAMVHIALPHSGIDLGKGRSLPGHFADTAVPLLLNKLVFEFGCNKEELDIQVFGGSRAKWESNSFNIGDRNVQAVKKELAVFGLVWRTADVGGMFGRTVEMDVATGTPKLKRYPIVHEEW